MTKYLILILTLTACSATVEIPDASPDAGPGDDAGTVTCADTYWAQTDLACPEVPCVDDFGVAHPECVATCSDPTDTIFCNPDGAFCMNGSLSTCVGAP